MRGSEPETYIFDKVIKRVKQHNRDITQCSVPKERQRRAINIDRKIW